MALIFRIYDSQNGNIDKLDLNVLEKVKGGYHVNEINFNFDVSNASINNYREFGFYSGRSLSNAPLSLSGWIQWISFPLNGNSDYCIQIAFIYDSTNVKTKMFIRYHDPDKGFGAWQEIS